MDPTPPEKAPTYGPKRRAERKTIDSPMLKNPSVDGTYIENIIVATHTNDVKIAVAATVNGDDIFSFDTSITHSTVVTQLLFLGIKALWNPVCLSFFKEEGDDHYFRVDILNFSS